MSVRKSWDLVVIGGGVAGITVATRFATAGGSVALIEASHPGGTALTSTSIPARALRASAGVAHTVRRASDFGIQADSPEVDFAAIMRRKDDIVVSIATPASPEADAAMAVTVLPGHAHFVDSQTVRVGEDLHIGDQIVIATGSTASIPDIPGLRTSRHVTSDTIFDLTELPARLAVIGGGATGLELGQAFARLGSDVTIIERNTRILHDIDSDHADRLRQRLKGEGMRIFTDTTVTEVHSAEHDVQSTLMLDHATGARDTLEADLILIATGRHPNIAHLGLDNAGVAIDDGHLDLDDLFRTNLEHIWACGDVTGGRMQENVAEDQARALATNLLGGATSWNSDAIPWAVFTDPPVAGLGMTRPEARGRYSDRLEVLRLPFDQIDRAVTEGDADGEIMVLLHPDWLGGRGGGRVIGAHIIGPHADELINQLVPFVQWRLPASMLTHAAQVWPTHATGVRQAMELRWLRDPKPPKPSLRSRIRRWWRD